MIARVVTASASLPGYLIVKLFGTASGHGFNRAATIQRVEAVLTAEVQVPVPPRRAQIAGTFFVTSRTWESRKLFIKPPVCEIFIEALLDYRNQQNYLLHSFVLMPDHFHLLMTPGPAVALERAVQFIKGGSARRICQRLNFRLPVWQRGFTDHRIRDGQDYRTHLRYIEENSVKQGLALAANEYPWSSASGRFAMDELPQGLKPLRQRTSFGTVETVP